MQTVTLPRAETLRGADLKKSDLVVSKGAYNSVVAASKSLISDAQKETRKALKQAGDVVSETAVAMMKSATMSEGAMEAGTYTGVVVGRLLDHATDGPKFGETKNKEVPLSGLIGVPARIASIWAPKSWGPIRGGIKGVTVGLNSAMLVHVIDQIKASGSK